MKQKTANIPSRSRSRRTGATAVEFAVTVPFVLYLFFAAVELSYVNMIRNTAENAAYEGARRGVVPGATSQQVETAARNTLNVVGISNASVTVSPQVIVDETETVTVDIAIPLDENTVVTTRFFAGTTLNKSCTLTRERTRRRAN